MNPLSASPGYQILDNHIPADIIDSINSKLNQLRPVRAVSSDRQYREKDAICELPDIAVWWSQTVMDWIEVRAINTILLPEIYRASNAMTWYSSDIVTINANSKWVNPHVDTPHRFEKYNFDERTLGIQCVVALQDTTQDMGVTGLIPDSHEQDWDINQCYAGAFNKYFYDNCIQETLTKGSVLIYNARILHSSMPNLLPEPRPMLLLNYLDSDIIDDVKQIDNIWSSNG